MVTPSSPDTATDGSPGDAFSPEDWAPAPARGSRRRWRLAVLGVVALVLAGVGVGAAVVQVPYYAMQPGGATDTSLEISITGAPVYASDGSINYTTVRIRQLTLFEMFLARFDDDVEIRTREELFHNRSREEQREQNRIWMDTSQLDATFVALEAVGYEPEVTLGGEEIHAVMEGYPADGVLEPGDVIVELEGEVLDRPLELMEILGDRSVGDEVDLVVERPSADGERAEHTLVLVADEDDPDRAVMGIVVGPHALAYDFPVDVDFAIDGVGGPSAGLAFTLTIIDLLTEGDLTGGLDVAVTGTIAIDGTVGTVGGTGQKAAAARSNGMDLFLVPATGLDYENALPHAGDVEVVAVASLDEALDALAAAGGQDLELPAVDLDAA